MCVYMAELIVEDVIRISEKKMKIASVFRQTVNYIHPMQYTLVIFNNLPNDVLQLKQYFGRRNTVTYRKNW